VSAQESALRSYWDFYLAGMRQRIQVGFQYRAATYMYTVGMLAEPVIYLVVWRTIANQHGGTINGVGAGQIAAYYIVWTVVRTFNIVFTPFGWEWRIREGTLSAQLLRPIHPVHYDMADFAGQKFPWLVMYSPLALGLALVFHPSLHPRPLEILVFIVAIWGAYVIRSLNHFVLGMLTLFTTRATSVFQIWFLAELLVSGRLVPLSFMPHWAQTLAAWLPFKWTFYFPIESLVGSMSTQTLLTGLLWQCLWTAIGSVLVFVTFRLAIRHYSAVGN
jgi:viologen exporter family transport system permease protein